MNRKKILNILALGILLVLAACSGTANTDSATKEQSYSVTMKVLPEPPVVGDVLLYFTVLDANGEPVTGANVAVSADHTDMSGMGMHGDATDQGKGVYAVTTNFSMTGNWKIMIEMSNGADKYNQDFDLIIN